MTSAADPSLRIGPLAAVRVFCHDLAGAREFYGAQLGLTETSANDDWLTYDVGSVNLVVERVSPDDDHGYAGRFTALSFGVDDAAAVCDALERVGVPIVSPPSRQPWGGTLANIADPSGNILTLVEYPRVRPI